MRVFSSHTLVMGWQKALFGCLRKGEALQRLCRVRCAHSARYKVRRPLRGVEGEGEAYFLRVLG
jgi:hypothetical protein